ncbi:MAG: hypothetical protein B0D96_12430 [Candidatus Sedimenticola endophacoides]|uniref:Uncharacterized protein n=1 Tax=Candidatus Sedimenticola endophacoides TaxID=2548426 RepID=A0A657PMU8_9GAMM|nr:MAG: hypothetical protein B0D94_11885 [Candidatus Sedimenticola endophacoides]OQX33000.1 MAG: hypothetical protein B0D96_12430 [Candidatus Sedimenticola endophacoides]OQX34257.1 MAG: hypothetical protein B0D84_03665 [Candidatus Sedimenticola endophacoides]OQX38461.1 MAG: hypothetical protein B0D89_12645 [Candidatus Sedimenticola endophacoides]OQX42718.1 MAG: hypothetical protein B0D82_00570 [Candidatus Sedimenticola endophacoides]
MTDLNTTEDLAIDSGAYQLGQNAFRSFALAGERYLVAGMKRTNTDEERFANFFGDLDTGQQDLLRSYFKRQAQLDLAQRAKVLGELVDLKISDRLTTSITSAPLMKSPSVMASIRGISPALRSLHLRRASPTVTALSSGNNRLILRLERIKVEESQDDYYIWPFGTYNKTDEVTLGVLTIDESGWVKQHSHNLGSISEGNQKTFSDKRLCSFDLREGGEATWPKVYSATVYAIERDDGGYNDFLQKAARYAKEKVTEELISRGIIAAGAWLGITIPPIVASFIANYVKGFFDSLIDWLASLFTNEDDVLGQHVRTASIHSYTGNWVSSGSRQSASWNWVYAGEGGRWSTRMHWLLENSTQPES